MLVHHSDLQVGSSSWHLLFFTEVGLGRTGLLQTVAHAALVANQSALFTGIPLRRVHVPPTPLL